ncbi:MAG TPA: enoyl-CoA hydratase-related protein [Pseudonocardia sp.]
MSDFLEIDRAGAIWTIRLNRPDARNAIDPATARELAQVWTELDHDPEGRVAVITGTGTAFCAGADLRELGEASEVMSLLQQALLGPARISKPVIAAANGVAVGGGLSLLLACDLRIAADTASFSTQAARSGLYPFGQVNALTREIGLPAAAELLFTARRFHADEALRLGILGEVVEPERLMPRCLELAATIAANAPLTVSAIKRTYAAQRSALMASEQDAVVEVLASADAKEGALSFLEQRPPRFTGR